MGPRVNGPRAAEMTIILRNRFLCSNTIRTQCGRQKIWKDFVKVVRVNTSIRILAKNVMRVRSLHVRLSEFARRGLERFMFIHKNSLRHDFILTRFGHAPFGRKETTKAARSNTNSHANTWMTWCEYADLLAFGDQISWKLHVYKGNDDYVEFMKMEESQT